MTMFEKGQTVVCIDESLGSIGAILEKNAIYHVEECQSPEECSNRWPAQTYWMENGGRVVLKEYPKLAWFARRFKLAEAKK